MNRFHFSPFFILPTLLIIIFDQLSKYLLFSIKPQWSWGILSLHLVQNTGAGFGILKGHTQLLALVSLLVVMLICWYYPQIPQEKKVQILFGIFLGGVIGNFIDRAFRRYVIDFIDFSFWPAFNVADAAITCAAIGLMIYYWKK